MRTAALREGRIGVAVAAALWLACVGPEDVPSNVHDLRVLGIQAAPPELMAPACVFDLEDPRAKDLLLTFAQPVELTALISDPAGEGRELRYELRACAATRGAVCAEDAPSYLLAPDPQDPSARGVTTAGELKLTVTPALAGVDLASGDFSNSLLAAVLERDTYRGLGGIRVPLVLRVWAGEEEIYAQKLMVYSCNFFAPRPGYDGPTMTQNENPQLPGVTVEGDVWEEGEVPVLQGPGPFVMEPVPFEDRQVQYVVPTFELEPLVLTERWRIAWQADLGTLSPNQTGGAEYGGEPLRHRVEWKPPRSAQEGDVRFWFVVRDGRGGMSWLKRTARYVP